MSFTKYIYISGPISSNPDYKIEFALAQSILQKDADVVINPAAIVLPYADKMPESERWAEYLLHDIKIITELKDKNITMVLLPNWKLSKGSCLEHTVAASFGIDVEYMSDKVGGVLKWREKVIEATESLKEGKVYAT